MSTAGSDPPPAHPVPDDTGLGCRGPGPSTSRVFVLNKRCLALSLAGRVTAWSIVNEACTSPLRFVEVIQSIAERDAGYALSIIVSCQVCRLLRELSHQLASMICSGSYVAGLAITGDHGTDLRKPGVYVENNRLRGCKKFTTNAAYAQYFVVYAHQGDDPVLALVPRTCAIVDPLIVPGYESAGIGNTCFDCSSLELLAVGDVAKRKLFKILNVGRLGLSALSLGLAFKGLKLITRSLDAEILGEKLMERQGLRWRIGMLYSEVKVLNAFIREVASKGWDIDPVDAAIAKYMASSIAQKVALELSRLSGAKSLVSDDVKSLFYAALGTHYAEGANEALLDFVASKVLKELRG